MNRAQQMTKSKTKTHKADDLVSMKEQHAAGGEALRRRLAELWERWDDELKARLEESSEGETEGAFKDLEILTIVSERDFPDGRELGPLAWSAYQEALKLEAGLKEKFEALGGGSIRARQFAKELSAYGAARERAGYRGAQLEMLVADHVANLEKTAAGNAAKSTRAEQRLQLLVNYVMANSLTMVLPGAIAKDENHRTKINKEIKSLGSLAEKQLQRELVKAFGILRSDALVPHIAKIDKAQLSSEALLRERREELLNFIRAANVVLPSNDKQFEQELSQAIRKAQSAPGV
jgi:hypothetical protein